MVPIDRKDKRMTWNLDECSARILSKLRSRTVVGDVAVTSLQRVSKPHGTRYLNLLYCHTLVVVQSGFMQ